MAKSPRESRAPPPSPEAGELSPPENDELAGFLSRSLHVPELILPDRIFPRKPTLINPPIIDFAMLMDRDSNCIQSMLRSAASIGVFQIVNHGISDDMVTAAKNADTRIFSFSPEMKKAAARSPERRWGFEIEDENENEEVFWWCPRAEEEMAGLLPRNYLEESSGTLGSLWLKMEKIAARIQEIVLKEADSCEFKLFDGGGSGLCIQKLSKTKKDDGPHEMLKMLIRSSISSNLLSLHVSASAASAFHVYSKRGWTAFPPTDNSIIVTIGNQIQALSDGLYKCVIGKHVFYDDNHHSDVNVHDQQDQQDLPLSFTFLHSSDHRNTYLEEKSIPLAQQIMVAAFLTLLYHFIYKLYAQCFQT